MISVVIASYNGGKYIEEQIDSILAQTRLPDEIIISDDCSTDNTMDLVRNICDREEAKGTPVAFRLLENEKNQGYIRNFKTALEASQGNVIFLCDQDDIWLPTKIEKMTGLMARYPQIRSLASSFSLIDGEGNPMRDYDRKGTRNQKLMKRKVPVGKITQVKTRELIYHNFCQGCAMAFTEEVKEMFLKNFRPEIPHDWQLNLAASVVEGAYFYNRKLFCYRIHQNNTTGMAEGQSLEEKESSDIRLTVPRQGLANLQYLQRSYPDCYQKDKALQARMKFTQNNLQAMENRRFFSLLAQNCNPFYREMKTFLGRTLDLWYVVRCGSK